MPHRRRCTPLLVAGFVGLASCSTDHPRLVGRAGHTNEATDPSSTDPSSTDPSSTDPSSTDPSSTGKAPSVRLAWESCNDPAIPLATVECAALAVPLDHDRPAGTSINLALLRRPASGTREGAVLVNPGGPGGSGVEFAAILAAIGGRVLGNEVLDRFDIVGFDPRGVDRSAGIECVDNAWLDANLSLDPTPDNPEEASAQQAADDQFEQGCQTTLGPSLGLYSTVATADDMDLIRAALGDEQITYLGVSYGTYLGGVYATRHPTRVRAMVLDSAYSPAGDDPLEAAMTQVVGFERAFENWAEWCRSAPRCGLASDPAPRWDALRIALDSSPLSVDGRTVNEAVLLTATIASLYAEATWPMLASALTAAETGDGGGLLRLADQFHRRSPDGEYATIWQSHQVISCASGIGQAGIPPAEAEGASAAIRAAAPRFGADITADDLGEGCEGLTGPIVPAPISADGVIPIIVVGGTNDPATPFRWAEKMAGELQASLITYDGEGHGSLTESGCVAQAARELILSGERPEPGLVCTADEPTPPPDWWADQPVVEGTTTTDITDVASIIGVPDAYADMLATDADAATTVERFIAAYEASGWRTLGQQALELGDDAIQVAFIRDGVTLAVTVIGEASFSDAETAELAMFVPDGHGLVIRFPPPG